MLKGMGPSIKNVQFQCLIDEGHTIIQFYATVSAMMVFKLFLN
jgi:hypothetical protein